jgi:hypothetical protein
MNTAVRHVETDALGALRAELVRAGRRAGTRRRRRRRAATLLAAALGLLALAAGAAAVANFSTGVPAVDELLEREAPSAPVPGEAPRLDTRPGPGAASEPLTVSLGGTHQAVAYLSRDGHICTATADHHRGGVRGSYGGCLPVDMVNRHVENSGGIWSGSAIGADSRTNFFLVDGEVESIRALGDGDWTVRMTPPWTAEAPDTRALRLVVVIDDADVGNPDDGLQPNELPPRAFDEPKLELTYGDGRTRVREGRQAK